MGMGYGANWADVIEAKKIKKVGKCRKLFEKLEDALEAVDVSIEDLAIETESYGDVEEAVKNGCFDAEKGVAILDAYQALVDEFTNLTGLPLYLNYHNQDDEGGRYDEVSGVYWTVGGYREVSKAGKAAEKKFKLNIERKGFVTFG